MEDRMSKSDQFSFPAFGPAAGRAAGVLTANTVRVGVAALLLACPWSATAQIIEQEIGEGQIGEEASSGGDTYAVVISGLGGDPDYAKMIDGWGKDLSTALNSGGVAPERLYWLSEKKTPDSYAEASRERVQQLLRKLEQEVKPEDIFQLYLIGHGSYDGYEYRFNIPGPDFSAEELGGWLQGISSERQLIVNMTSASGAAIIPLRKKGRALITSTAAGQERNFSVFARYFVAAVQDDASDADKNQAISSLEAYRYATREVARYYESMKRLATEHATIEDLGDSDGAREATPETGQGLLAAAIVVRRLGQARASADTPQIRRLRARKLTAEEAIEQLKYAKASMETGEYFQKLEQLLVNLAQIQARLDELEGQ